MRLNMCACKFKWVHRRVCLCACAQRHRTHTHSNTHTLMHTHTQVVRGDSLVSHGTRRTVSSVMDTSFLFFNPPDSSSSHSYSSLPPSLPPPTVSPSLRHSFPSSSSLFFLCLRTSHTCDPPLRRQLLSWASFFFLPSHIISLFFFFMTVCLLSHLPFSLIFSPSMYVYM